MKNTNIRKTILSILEFYSCYFFFLREMFVLNFLTYLTEHKIKKTRGLILLC